MGRAKGDDRVMPHGSFWCEFVPPTQRQEIKCNGDLSDFEHINPGCAAL